MCRACTSQPAETDRDARYRRFTGWKSATKRRSWSANFSPFRGTRKRVLKLERRWNERGRGLVFAVKPRRETRSRSSLLGLRCPKKKGENRRRRKGRRRVLLWRDPLLERIFSRYYDRLFSSVRALSFSLFVFYFLSLSLSRKIDRQIERERERERENFSVPGGRRGARSNAEHARENGSIPAGKLISADEEKKIKISSASVFSRAWPSNRRPTSGHPGYRG